LARDRLFVTWRGVSGKPVWGLIEAGPASQRSH